MIEDYTMGIKSNYPHNIVSHVTIMTVLPQPKTENACYDSSNALVCITNPTMVIFILNSVELST